MKTGSEGLAIGIAVGVAIGAAIGNIGAGIAIGIAIGVAIGASQRKKGAEAEPKSKDIDDESPPN